MNINQSVFLAALSVLSLVSCVSTTAPVSDTAPLTLKRIYQDKEFKGETAPYFRWLDNGSGYTVLEPRDKTKKAEAKDEEHGVKGNDIVFYQPDGSGRKVLVSLEQLTPAGAKEALSIEDYQWSDNGQWLLLFSNGEKVWRSRSSAMVRKYGAPEAAAIFGC
jgi:dipeptidyl-peptidase 4